ncbi:hypothetical protein ACWGQ2_00595 [Arthrobacter sp. NPDC055585]
MNDERDRSSGRNGGPLARLRALPGSRTATVAFVLTIALAAGGSAAYAFWSQRGDAKVTVVAGAPQSTPTPTPAPTTAPTPAPGAPGAVTPNIQTAWAGKPSGITCGRVQVQEPKSIGLRVSWPNLSTATSYVVSVQSLSAGYTYPGPSQTVGSPHATFVFPDDRAVQEAPFYTRYVIRVMPMKGTTGGDPLYLTFQHGAYETNNCFDPRDTERSVVLSPLPFTALTCRLAALNNTSPTAELPLAWTPVPGATSYRVSIRPAAGSSRTHGADVVTASTSASFRFPIADTTGKYVVRVQPMNGTSAGDPAYVTYRMGNMYDHGCEVTGETFR